MPRKFGWIYGETEIASEKNLEFETWTVQDTKDKLDFIIKDLGNLKMDINRYNNTDQNKKKRTGSENFDYIYLYNMPRE